MIKHSHTIQIHPTLKSLRIWMADDRTTW